MKSNRIAALALTAAVFAALILPGARATAGACNFREQARRVSEPGTDYFASKLDAAVAEEKISAEQRNEIVSAVEDALDAEFVSDFKAAVNKLTAEGTLKSGQASRVTYAVSEAVASGRSKVSEAIESIVSEGSLTPQQADFIKAAAAQQRRLRMNALFESALSKLETDGTLSADARRALSEGVQNAGLRGLGTALNKCLGSGAITPEQENRIFEAVGEAMKEAMRQRFEAAIHDLAKDKRLTEEQAAAAIGSMR